MIRAFLLLCLFTVQLSANLTPRILVTCPIGQYDNGGVCQNCDASCLTCDGSTSTSCLSCKQDTENKYYDVVKKKCKTICGFSSQYLDETNNHCIQCHTDCIGCFGPNINNCNYCSGLSGKFLMFDTNTCIPFCPIGTFIYQLSPKMCKKCPNGCDTCTDLTDQPCECCNTADPLFAYQFLTKCYPACPSGTYLADPSNKICESCHESCGSCTSGSAEGCDTCKSDLYIHNNKCNTDCPNGFFKDEIFKRCSACVDDNCEICLATGCQVCKAGKILSSTSQTCVSCDSSCLECTGPSATDCKNCAAPLILHSKQCLETCPDGTFFSSNSCTQCHSSCNTCTSGSSSSCLTCPTGTIKASNGECQSCKSPCQTCIRDPSQCTSCKQGYFISSRYSCTSCSRNCGSCSGEALSNCEACSEGYFMTAENECVSECPRGTYPDEKSMCQPCHPNCKTCLGKREENCKSCLSPKFLHNNICRDSCPEWTYQNLETRACEEKTPITVNLVGVKNPSIFKLTLSSYQKYYNEYLDLIMKDSFLSVGELYSYTYSSSFKKPTEEQGVVYIYITFWKLADLTGKYIKLFPPETTLQEGKFFYKYQSEGIQVPLVNLSSNGNCSNSDALFRIGKYP
jgi:proprotein convertase subtilisin/kexin type 5